MNRSMLALSLMLLVFSVISQAFVNDNRELALVRENGDGMVQEVKRSPSAKWMRFGKRSPSAKWMRFGKRSPSAKWMRFGKRSQMDAVDDDF